MPFELPPIVKQAERLLVDIEEAVRRFPRYHKYTHGAELRTAAMRVTRLTHRAWRDRRQQAHWLDELVWAIDELKITMQLGQRVRAYSSLRQFEHIARQARQLGKQAGGWRKQQHPKGQNPAPPAASECAQTLSTRTASAQEATP
ncbi:four helix bundle protein [Algiphilus sp.]|uniref:four helix bundle protein n=1 Tax=Algiphilus sp. TaxID=1872431 RepID=UPI0025C2F56C|nr:four helix bundle protein [Algiphilus sp.]MCK5770902.1 four helix bundle protein [Algiphilus sp.]